MKLNHILFALSPFYLFAAIVLCILYPQYVWAAGVGSFLALIYKHSVELGADPRYAWFPAVLFATFWPLFFVLLQIENWTLETKWWLAARRFTLSENE